MSGTIDPNVQYADDGFDDLDVHSASQPHPTWPGEFHNTGSSPWEALPVAQNPDDRILWDLEVPLPQFDFDATGPEDTQYDVQSSNSRHESLSSIEFAELQSSPPFSRTSSTAATLQIGKVPARAYLTQSPTGMQTSANSDTAPDRARPVSQVSWPQNSIDSMAIRQSTPPSTSSPASKPSRSVPARNALRSRPVSSANSIASNDDDDTLKRIKRSHSLVERRYREGLNRKLDELEEALSHTQLSEPSRISSRTQHATVDSPARKKTKKSDVLSNAMNYIHTSEVEMRHLSSEIACLKERVRHLERLVKCEECSTIAELSLMRSTG